jgi:hypothetical protein
LLPVKFPTLVLARDGPDVWTGHIELEEDKASAAISLKRQRHTKRGRELMLLALSLTPPVIGIKPM